jgi:3-deoxy-D-manno-octulosonate 8-phosphate phosphatase (KDO 8-P phosphatase)
MQDILRRAANIKLVIFDVDGVLTDGRLIIDDRGVEYKAFHSRDGHGMKMLQETGVQIGIITGRSSEVVTHRMANLGVTHVYQGQKDKVVAYEEVKTKLGLAAEQIAFVGDDVVDLPVMRRVGFAVAVADAHEFVKKHAHWHTPSGGGRGAARDVCELIMEAQRQLHAKLSEYVTDREGD